MFSRFNKSAIFSLLMLSLTTFAHATTEGAGSGGGGDARCQEFSSMAESTALKLEKIGQARIDTINPMIKADVIWAVKSKLVCLPADRVLDRMAISYPDLDKTELNVLEASDYDPHVWQHLSIQEKSKLVYHELSVLAKYEKDGEYFMSDDMYKIIAAFDNSPDSVISRIQQAWKVSLTYNPNTDGSVTFIANPLTGMNAGAIAYNIQDAVNFANGVCKFLGFNEATHSSFTVGSNYFVNPYPDTYAIQFVSIHNDGSAEPGYSFDLAAANPQNKKHPKYEYAQLSSIICK